MKKSEVLRAWARILAGRAPINQEQNDLRRETSIGI